MRKQSGEARLSTTKFALRRPPLANRQRVESMGEQKLKLIAAELFTGEKSGVDRLACAKVAAP